MPDVSSLTLPVSKQNAVTKLITGDGSSNPPAETTVRHDAAGNLIFDGTYAYQYDAWNRVVQINKAHIGIPDLPPET